MRYKHALLLISLAACVLAFAASPCFASNWSTNQSANYVVGQTNMTSALTGATAYSLNASYTAYASGTKLYICDYTSSRVLIYNNIPTVNNASADVVVGQTDMTSSGFDVAAAYNLYNPYTAYTDGTKLYIADTSAYRVLIYNNIPTVNNASADVVVGQTSMTTVDSSGVNAYTLGYPSHVYASGTKLYICDYTGSRVLIYNNIPTVNNASADVVVGQTDMASTLAGTTAYSLKTPFSVYASGTKLYIVDYGNYRTLIYNNIPTVNNASADVVVGQTSMTTLTGGTTAYLFTYPIFACVSGTKLYIADNGNSRVLIYNNIPTVNNASADVVVGQTNMTSALAGTTAYGSTGPASVYTSGTKLYICDNGNNRVLIYNLYQGDNAVMMGNDF